MASYYLRLMDGQGTPAPAPKEGLPVPTDEELLANGVVSTDVPGALPSSFSFQSCCMPPAAPRSGICAAALRCTAATLPRAARAQMRSSSTRGRR